MLTNYRDNSSKFGSPLSRLVVSIFCLCCFCGRTLAAQDQQSAQVILRHFYQAVGGSAWQHYEECDSEGMATVAGKTGSMHYVEDLRSGANVFQVEIPALDVKQVDGDGPIKRWRQGCKRRHSTLQPGQSCRYRRTLSDHPRILAAEV